MVCGFPWRASVVMAAVLLAAGLLARPVGAQDFPPVTAEERALTMVDWEPEAPAVVLRHEGILRLWGSAGADKASILIVHVRIRVLTDAGIEQFGTVEIPHSRRVRLREFQGRTILPDGREIPLAEDSIFERRSSRSRRLFVTSAAFPGLQVGAILDYRYKVTFKSIFQFDPWDFQTTIPVLKSQITTVLSPLLGLQIWRHDPLKVGVQQSKGFIGRDHELRVWAEKLPSVVEEPDGPPLADLTARFMVVPILLGDTPLFANWRDTCSMIYSNNYKRAQRKGGDAKREAARLVAGMSKRAGQEKAEAIYHFVRDEIETTPSFGVVTTKDQSLNKVVRDREGSYAAKGLLLATMLRAVDLDSDLVWAASRREGKPDMGVANPYWFDRSLVRLQLGAKELFLDPSDRTLAFGSLHADFEGTRALVFSETEPEVITLPVSGWERNLKRAELDLNVDEEGRLSGTGSLTMTGHSAVAQLGHGELPLKHWTDWLEEEMSSFEVSAVEVEELVEERRLNIRWRLQQRLEEVLGDEVSWLPSQPLGPAKQRFTMPQDQRQSPVMLPFGTLSELEATVTWPQDWELDLVPEAVQLSNPVGAFELSTSVSETGNSVSVSRRIEIHGNFYSEPSDYGHLQHLWGRAEKSDAQSLVLVRQ